MTVIMKQRIHIFYVCSQQDKIFFNIILSRTTSKIQYMKKPVSVITNGIPAMQLLHTFISKDLPLNDVAVGIFIVICILYLH